MEKVFRVLSLMLYVLLLSFSAGLLWLFRPVTLQDNFNSYLNCSNNTYYQAGSNFIFSTDGKLDQFNDKKARKLCDHGIILDYGDSYPTNPQVNYTYLPVTRQDSSWLQALLVASIPLLPLVLFKKKTKSKLLLLAALTCSLFVFYILLKPSADRLYCQRTAYLQSEEFKKSVNKAGRLLHEKDEEHQRNTYKEILKSCLGS